MKLGINTGFAVNRYPLPEQWMRIIGIDLGLRHVQLTADLINPSWGSRITRRMVEHINRSRMELGVSIESVMTGAFTRVNHFSHPDAQARRYWMRWFKSLADIAVSVGAHNLSSHLGILCYDDLADKNRRSLLLKETISSWKELAEYGRKIGLTSLSWEPMSIKREYGETIEEVRRIQCLLEGSAIPVYLCLDVDHGDVTSPNPKDTDYREWLKEFHDYARFIHIKQSLKDKGGHYPFIKEYNAQGKIRPLELLNNLSECKTEEAFLFLELSFREREPADSLVLQHLKESVAYWKKEMELYA